jgi:hypothetical protein
MQKVVGSSPIIRFAASEFPTLLRAAFCLR